MQNQIGYISFIINYPVLVVIRQMKYHNAQKYAILFCGIFF
jgi:hypothetical protein